MGLRGVLAVVLGLFALFAPFRTVAALVIVFGVYVVFDSVLLMLAGLRAHEKNAPRWWVLVGQGFVGTVAGLVALFAPLFAASLFVYIAAFWAIFTGVLEIISAVRLRREIKNEWALGIAGVFSVLLGIGLFAVPGAGLVIWSYLIAAYALISGVSLLLLAFRLRSHPAQAAL